MQTDISGENLVDVGDQKCSSSMIHIPTKEAVVFQNTLRGVAVEYTFRAETHFFFAVYILCYRKKLRL